MDILYYSGIVTEEVKRMSFLVDDVIDPERDFLFGYFGIKTLEKGYLMKVKDVVVETPQYLYMRVALGIHGADIEAVTETYNAMSNGACIHATPTLFNAGTHRPQMSSCFLVSNKWF